MFIYIYICDLSRNCLSSRLRTNSFCFRLTMVSFNNAKSAIYFILLCKKFNVKSIWKLIPWLRIVYKFLANFRFVIKVFMFEIFNFETVGNLENFSLSLSAHSFLVCTNNFDLFNLIEYLTFSLVHYFEFPDLKQWNKKFCIYILCNIKYYKIAEMNVQILWNYIFFIEFDLDLQVYIIPDSITRYNNVMELSPTINSRN